MSHETVTSVVGLLLKIYLFKHDEDQIKHSNLNHPESEMAIQIAECLVAMPLTILAEATSPSYEEEAVALIKVRSKWRVKR